MPCFNGINVFNCILKMLKISNKKLFKFSKSIISYAT